MRIDAENRSSDRPKSETRSGFLLASLVLAMSLFVVAGCPPPKAPATGCEPQCQGGCGTADGCGGTCGCGSGELCRDGNCVPATCADCGPFEICVANRCICEPKCHDNPCGDDGCGDTCDCPPGYIPNATGRYVPEAECHDSCASTGNTCGPVCLEDCGTCPVGQDCAGGHCVCEPVCDGTRCSDGCGGICECGGSSVCNAEADCVAPEQCHDTCESTGRACGSVCGEACGTCQMTESCIAGQCHKAISCPDCSFKLSLVQRSVVGGRLQQVVLRIDYEPAEGEARPRMADLRIRANREIELADAQPGAALEAAGKDLFYDELTGKRWMQQGSRVFRVLAYRATNTQEFAPGVLATLTFTLDELGPVEFSFVRRGQVLAPGLADAALASSPYDLPVVVSR